MSKYRIEPDTKVKLDDFDPDDAGKFAVGPDGSAEIEERIAKSLGKLRKLQERLYAEGKQALLIVLQAMDAGGKDGTIKHVMSGVNPQGCDVTSFKVPTPQERAHDFLWRVHQHVPPLGNIGLFNRSHYEDVLVTRVHGELSDKDAKRRMKHIVRFESLLADSGITIVKFFLYISEEEQRSRLEARFQNPEKRWKFNPADITERSLWKKYMDAYEDVLSATSTDQAPWYVIPANHKLFRNLVVAEIIVKTLEHMNPQYPEVLPDADLEAMKKL